LLCGSDRFPPPGGAPPGGGTWGGLLGVNHPGGLEKNFPRFRAEPLSTVTAGADLVMAVGPDEDHRSAPLSRRNRGEILRESKQRGHAAGVVTGGVEPAIAVRDDVHRFVRGARQRAPYQERLLTRHPFRVEANRDVRRGAWRRGGHQIAHGWALVGPP